MNRSQCTPHIHDYGVLLSSLGEVGLPQTKQESIISRLILGLPETVYVRGADQSAGAPETPECALPQQDSGQQPRVKVSITNHLKHASVKVLRKAKTAPYVPVCCLREEWQWLQALSSLEESVEMGHEEQSAPHRLLQDLRTAIKDLMAHINVPGNQVRVALKTGWNFGRSCQALERDWKLFLCRKKCHLCRSWPKPFETCQKMSNEVPEAGTSKSPSTKNIKTKLFQNMIRRFWLDR